ncbi:lysoplasmalogenase [Aurantibacter crassamenti]|uniref:lysoplasmalogenase n=1 Tax=Aurantibacter crassamenti TaxID=1837375 RepID=UPI0019394CCA|nr:lysoplasmalogenase [Aurantibacter crassamenti]MBM1107883.1 lysoplasmalogenase [Aurantibacter crassamenti]
MKHLKPFLRIFSIILLIELILISTPDWWSYRIFTKPLVVGSLLVFFLMQQVNQMTKKLVSAALILCIIGDILLIYARNSTEFFIAGVSAFMIGHIFYAIQFSRIRNKNVGVLAPLAVLLGYAIPLFYYLSNALYNMAIPVGIYVVVLLIMILFAYLREDSTTNNSYIYVLAGALLFMLSDSILAITKFKIDIPFSKILVMGIYGIAQLLMIIGILKNSVNSPSINSN